MILSLDKFTHMLAWLILSILSSTLHAEDVAWIKDQNGCGIANPNPQAKESVTWSGGCKDGAAHGQGILQWFEDGSPTARYEGELESGWAEGAGALNTPDGVSYKGDWKRSREHGEGRMEWPNGAWYQGEWRDGKPNGYGQYRTPDGKLVTGKFVDGQFEPAPNEEQPVTDDQSRT